MLLRRGRLFDSLDKIVRDISNNDEKISSCTTVLRGPEGEEGTETISGGVAGSDSS